MFDLGTGLGGKDEFPVSGREFQSHGPIKKEAHFCPVMIGHSYGKNE